MIWMLKQRNYRQRWGPYLKTYGDLTREKSNNPKSYTLWCTMIIYFLECISCGQYLDRTLGKFPPIYGPHLSRSEFPRNFNDRFPWLFRDLLIAMIFQRGKFPGFPWWWEPWIKGYYYSKYSTPKGHSCLCHKICLALYTSQPPGCTRLQYSNTQCTQLSLLILKCKFSISLCIRDYYNLQFPSVCLLHGLYIVIHIQGTSLAAKAARAARAARSFFYQP